MRLLKNSQGQSLHHDLCLDSVENGISVLCFGILVFYSFLLVQIGQFGRELKVLMSSCLASSNVFPLHTYETQSPLRVKAFIMIFSEFPSSSASKFSSSHISPLLTHQTQSPLRVTAFIMIFSEFQYSSDSKST